MEIDWSVIAREEEDGHFGIGVTLNCFQKSGKLPLQMQKQPKHTTKTGGGGGRISGKPNCEEVNPIVKSCIMDKVQQEVLTSRMNHLCKLGIRKI